MRIGIDARMYGPRVTGIGNYVRYLTESLLALNAGDQFVFFLSPADCARFRAPRPGVTAVAVATPWYGWQEQLRLPWPLLAERCDVLHFPNFNVPLAYRRKFVVTIHDLTPLRYPGPVQRRNAMHKAAYRFVLRQTLRRAAAIVAVSRHTASEITEFYPACGQRVKIIYPGLSTDFHSGRNYGIVTTVLGRYGIRPPYIFYVGVWRDHKNIPGLLEAFKILRQRNRALQLVLAGDQADADTAIAPRLKEFGPGEVATPGFIPDQHLPVVFHGAAVTVIPSYNEGFGLVGVESLACGTPVAASVSTSLPEVLGQAGRYFPPDNPHQLAAAVEGLLTPEGKATVMAHAEAVVQRYQWPLAARQTLALYHQVLRGRL